METKELIEIIKQIIQEDIIIKNNTCLIGGDSCIDSMNLVQICIALEDRSKKDNFEFDWTSEKAMSSMNSIFKTPNSIADEFNKQLMNQKKA